MYPLYLNFHPEQGSLTSEKFATRVLPHCIMNREFQTEKYRHSSKIIQHVSQNIVLAQVRSLSLG